MTGVVFLGTKGPIQNAFKDEAFIVNYVKEMAEGNITLFPNNLKMKLLCRRIFNSKAWVNNSEDTKNPPDFYAKIYRLMMDVMQISEYADKRYLNSKGDPIDQLQRLEGELIKDFVGRCPQDINPIKVIPIVNDDKLIECEHNYRQWFDEFKRVVGKHNVQAKRTYQKNHPGYKTILFVYDHSAMYGVASKKQNKEDMKRGTECSCTELHCWYLDKNFIDFIASLDCEYIVWATLHKLDCNIRFTDEEMPPIPAVCIFDVAECKKMKTKTYDEELLVSLDAHSK